MHLAEDQSGTQPCLAPRILLATLVFAGIIALVPAVLFTHRSHWNEFTCLKCAAFRTTKSRSALGTVYYSEDRRQATPLSRALTSVFHASCNHQWLLIRFAGQSRSEAGHGGSDPMLRYLMKDSAFATEMEKLGRPEQAREIWVRLCRTLTAGSPEERRFISDWWGEGLDRPPLSEWYAANRSRFRASP